MKYKGTLIVVKDRIEALKFYQDIFGFELMRDHDGNMELFRNLVLQEEIYWKRFTGKAYNRRSCCTSVGDLLRRA